MTPVDAQIAALCSSEPRLAVVRSRPSCVVLEPKATTQRDLLHDYLLAPARREQFFALVDCVGLVIVRHVHADSGSYRDVRGRSSRGRLSQGEYYHHDGCSGPEKPRVVEIRCPYQTAPRTIATAIAPFPDSVYAMLRELPAVLEADAELGHWCESLSLHARLPQESLDLVQGLVTRAIRRGLSADEARAYFLAVDRRCDAYAEPWQMGESRFIANANARRTFQHRRAYAAANVDHIPNGRLLKRWPAEEL